MHGVKLYPAGATTHSEAGVRSLERVYPVLERMQDGRHAVCSCTAKSLIRRSTSSIARSPSSIGCSIRCCERFPGLTVVFEHITTRCGRPVRDGRDTPRGAPQSRRSTCYSIAMRCSPAACGRITTACRCSRREDDREALLAAATSGDPRFFLGTDSAPHARSAKEAACGCAGIFSAHAAIELYAEAFESAGALQRLEGIRLRVRRGLLRPAPQCGNDHSGAEEWQRPDSLPFGDRTTGAVASWRDLALAARVVERVTDA